MFSAGGQQSCNPGRPNRLRQECHEIETSLGCIQRCHFKTFFCCVWYVCRCVCGGYLHLCTKARGEHWASSSTTPGCFEWEMSPICSEYLNTFSPVGGSLWGGLGGAAFTREACHWVWAFMFIGLPLFQSLLLWVLGDVHTQLPALAASCYRPALYNGLLPLWTCKPNRVSLLKLPWSWGFIPATEK